MTFTQISTLLCTTKNSIGQPIEYPKEGTPEITAFLVEMAPGESTPWHQHPVPLLGYAISGELTVHQADGSKRVVREGEISLEAVGRIHQGVNEGSIPMKMIVFVVGLQGLPFTTVEEKP